MIKMENVKFCNVGSNKQEDQSLNFMICIMYKCELQYYDLSNNNFKSSNFFPEFPNALDIFGLHLQLQLWRQIPETKVPETET